MLKRLYQKSGLGHPETRLLWIFGALQFLGLIIYKWRFDLWL